MKFNQEELEKWLFEAAKRNYADSEVVSILKKNGFNDKEIERIMSLYSQFGNLDNYNPENKEKYEVKDDSLNQKIKEFAKDLSEVKKEVSKHVFGQEEVLDLILVSILCNAHSLVEGVPGIAKTFLIKAIGEVSGCTTKRVQFTADLLPTDITGIESYNPKKGFELMKGPIFANFVIADEINRSPPKTQSALLEAMQERQVTIGRETHDLPSPFFVLATQNPLEQSGVYTLPEAQVDRFLLKIIMGYPKKEDELSVMEKNISLYSFEDFKIKNILSPEKIITMQELVKDIYTDSRIKDYILDLVLKTRTKDFNKGESLEWGGSPRASISLFIASKAKALMNGRTYVVPQDVRDVIYPILRHRLILNYKAEAEGITTDDVIKEILKVVSPK